MYKVSFTGYRPQKLPFSCEDDPLCVELKERLRREIKNLIEHGAGEFFSGMALGVDMWAAEIVLKLKKDYPQIRLTAVIPCRGQESRWNPSDRQRYENIIKQCSKVIYISQEYTPDCMKRRNKALVELCDILIAVYDGKPGGTKFTVEYAKKLYKKTIVIPPVIGIVLKLIKVRYIGEDDIDMRYGDIFYAREVKDDSRFYGIVDRSGEEYAYPKTLFEIVDDE